MNAKDEILELDKYRNKPILTSPQVRYNENKKGDYMDNDKLLEKYMDKMDRDTSELKADIRAIEERRAQDIKDIEERRAQELRDSELRHERWMAEFDKKFDKIDKKFDKIDEKFDKIDEKFDKLNDKFDSSVEDIKKTCLETKRYSLGMLITNISIFITIAALTVSTIIGITQIVVSLKG